MVVAKVNHKVNDIIRYHSRSLGHVSPIIQLFPEVRSHAIAIWLITLARLIPILPVVDGLDVLPIFILVVEAAALDLGVLDCIDRLLLILHKVAVGNLWDHSLLVIRAPGGAGCKGGSYCMISCRALLTLAKFLWMSLTATSR